MRTLLAGVSLVLVLGFPHCGLAPPAQTPPTDQEYVVSLLPQAAPLPAGFVPVDGAAPTGEPAPDMVALVDVILHNFASGPYRRAVAVVIPEQQTETYVKRCDGVIDDGSTREAAWPKSNRSSADVADGIVRIEITTLLPGMSCQIA